MKNKTHVAVESLDGCSLILNVDCYSYDINDNVLLVTQYKTEDIITVIGIPLHNIGRFTAQWSTNRKKEI